jgi:hypothetical protein
MCAVVRLLRALMARQAARLITNRPIAANNNKTYLFDYQCQAMLGPDST